MFRSFTLMAIVASTLGGCRAPSTAPHFQGVAGPDASATTGKVHGVVGPNAPADPAAVIEYRGETVELTKRYDDFDIEIPHADADRVVIYLKDDHGYRLVDDTVLPELPIMAEVTVRDGKVTYRTHEGTAIAERPIRGHADR
jgi:hypothetical protein